MLFIRSMDLGLLPPGLLAGTAFLPPPAAANSTAMPFLFDTSTMPTKEEVGGWEQHRVWWILMWVVEKATDW